MTIILICKYSYHPATIPFSWKFSFDKLSKYDESCKIVLCIQFSMLTWSKRLVILLHGVSKLKYSKTFEMHVCYVDIKYVLYKW